MILGSCAGSLYALQRTTGATLWQYDTEQDGARAQFHGEPLLIGDRIILTTDAEPKGFIYSFDVASGEPQWKVPFTRGVPTSPLLIGDRIVAVSAEGDVFALEAKSGDIIWKKAPAGRLESMTPSPAYAANRVFVADNMKRVFALDVTTGATLWQSTLSGRPNTALVVAGSSIIAGTADGYLNWIAAESGEVKQRIRLEEGHPYGTPILAPPLLFVLAAGAKGNLIALDAESGAIRWKRETPKEWTTYRPLVTGANVIVGDEERTLCAFDRASGRERWCRPVGQVPRGLGITNDGILYVGSLSGVVQAFRIGAPN